MNRTQGSSRPCLFSVGNGTDGHRHVVVFHSGGRGRRPCTYAMTSPLAMMMAMPTMAPRSGVCPKAASPTVHPGKDDLRIGERCQRRGAGESKRIGQQQMTAHGHGAEPRHHQRVMQRRRLPIEDDQHAHHQAADQAGDEVAGHGMIRRAESAGDQLVEGKAQGSAERQQDRRREQGATRPHDDHHADQPAADRQPLGAADLLTEQGGGDGNEQRGQEDHRGRFGQRNVTEAADKQHADADQTQATADLQLRPQGTKHAPPHARREQGKHQSRLRHIACPDDQEHGVELCQVLGQPVVAGERQARNQDQRHAKQGPVRVIQWEKPRQ